MEKFKTGTKFNDLNELKGEWIKFNQQCKGVHALPGNCDSKSGKYKSVCSSYDVTKGYKNWISERENNTLICDAHCFTHQFSLTSLKLHHSCFEMMQIRSFLDHVLSGHICRVEYICFLYIRSFMFVVY